MLLKAKKLIEELAGIRFPIEYLDMDVNLSEQEVKPGPDITLFLWCVLFNRPEIAKVLLAVTNVIFSKFYSF